MQSATENNNKSTPNHYPFLDMVQFFCAILIVLIHNGRLTDNKLVHFILTTGVARHSVPIFLVSSGYFFGTKTRINQKYPIKYFKSHIKEYLFWSVIYLPYGILYIHSMSLPAMLYPLALLFGLFYSGVCYHLWYYPALFFGLFVSNKIYTKLPKILLFAGAGLFFSFGALETYSSYFSGTSLGNLYKTYQYFFVTTRNGLLYALIFIFLGYLLAEFQDKKIFTEKLLPKLFCCAILVAIEAAVIYHNPGNDKNFLFSSLPLSVFLVAFCLHTKFLKNKNFCHLKLLSKYIFFLHPLFLESLKLIQNTINFPVFSQLPLFAMTLTLSLATSHIIIYMGSQARKGRLY